VHNGTLTVVAVDIDNPDRLRMQSTALTLPQLQPALLRLSAMISLYFTRT
jgi:hypothetical protein